MTDIVERLRERLKQEAVGCGEPPVIGYTGDGRLLTDAADEIERLRVERRDSMSYPHQPGSLYFDGAEAYEAHREDFLTKRLAERGEEVERLKAALDEAADEIERLTLENWQLKGALGYAVPGDIPEGDFKCGLCEARHKHPELNKYD